LDTQQQQWHSSWRVGPLLSVFNGVLDQIALDLLLVELSPVEQDLKLENILGEVLHKVNERVCGHLVQAVLRQRHLVVLNIALVFQFAAPQSQLVEQVV